MLKHILTGQPSTGGSGRHQNDYHQGQQQQHQQQQSSSGMLTSQASSGVSLHHHHHHHHPVHGNPSEHHHHPHHQHFTASPATNRLGQQRIGHHSDVYDSVMSPNQRNIGITVGQSHQPTPSSTHRHPLNHSQLSVNNLSQRLNHSHALNLSTLSTSKHSVNSASPIVGNVNNLAAGNPGVHHAGITAIPHLGHNESRVQNGGLDISRVSRLPSQTTPSPAGVHATVSQIVQAPVANGPNPLVQLNSSWSSSMSKNNRSLPGQQEAGVKEMLTFLGLLCLVSLLLAMLSHIFLLKISPLNVAPSSLISPEEYTIVYEVTLALCALALSLNLCCLLVCAIQFLFAVKLVKSSYQGHRTNKYLQKSSISRVCAVGGFFVSIPVFLTGMILYTFIQFHSTPAIVMSVFIGLGIVFCGCAMVHNVFVWQREKTNAVKALARAQCEAAAQLQRQQQLQQQQQQQTGRGTVGTLHRGGFNGGPKIGNLTSAHSTTTLQQQSRGSAGAYAQQPQHHHHNHHRHVQMSPPLLLSSPGGLAGTHTHGISGQTGSAHGNHRILATPPTTPGDRSPPSPSTNKHSRSQSHLQRDASGSVSPGLPPATLDLSSAATTNSPHELSTLV